MQRPFAVSVYKKQLLQGSAEEDKENRDQQSQSCS
jgi:hypothetical protein